VLKNCAKQAFPEPWQWAFFLRSPSARCQPLFFGSLIPLALKQSSAIGLPLIYGLGTGLPVLGFALVVMFGVKQLGRLFHAVTKVEFWVRRATASVMILVGVHLSLLYIFNIDVLA